MAKKKAAAPDKVLIYDTTLRDGTQGEGVSFSVPSKLRIAEKLDQFGVDYIEGGWPGSNPRDITFFAEARKLKLKHAKIAAFGSTRRAKVSAAEDPQVQLLLDAQTPVVTIFGKTWLLHVTEILRTTADNNLAMIRDTVRHLCDNGREVVYDAEHFFDGYKDHAEYALKTLEAARDGGATTLALCDTNGGTMVREIDAIVRTVCERFPDTRVAMHCHDDCGLGVAVSLAGVEAGARGVQGTLNGIGERTGNANLTSILPNLALKLGYDFHGRKHLDKLRDLSLFLDEMANRTPDKKAPFVGASAFAHKGGVHADAANKVARSYEHIDPMLVGNRTRVLISDMSGRASIMMKAKEIGVELDSKAPEMKQFLNDLKELEYRGYEYEAADASFKLLLKRAFEEWEEPFEVLSYRVTVRRGQKGDAEGRISEATIKVRAQGQVHHVVAESTGPVGALANALYLAIGNVYPSILEMKLEDYKVRILESKKGTDAITRVQIDFTDGVEHWGTVGASDNIIEASWQALRDAIEYKLLRDGERTARKKPRAKKTARAQSKTRKAD